MDPLAAERLARSLLEQHGLADSSFAFDHARRRLGSCDYRARRITLSRPLSTLNPEAVVGDTILHEIAHALTQGARHGSAWRLQAAALGAEPRACVRASDIATPPPPPSGARPLLAAHRPLPPTPPPRRLPPLPSVPPTGGGSRPLAA